MKTQENKPITTAQIKKIHTLLNQQGLLDEKPTLVYSISDGRTQSTKELTVNEGRRLITFLLNDDNVNESKCVAVFRAIYRLAWDMDIIYGNTTDDYHMNVAKLNMFCRERGTVKKNLSQMDLTELRKAQRQFEAMYSKYKNKSKIEA